MRDTTESVARRRAAGNAASRITTTLDDKISAAVARGRRYTPDRDEWDRASRSQRDRMTWPADVLAWIRRGA